MVDPINGTNGYIHGDGRSCISLAFVRANRIELGVLYAPASGRLFVAQRGAASLLDGVRISVCHLQHGAPQIEFGWSDRIEIASYRNVLQRFAADCTEFRRHARARARSPTRRPGMRPYVELHINAWDD